MEIDFNKITELIKSASKSEKADFSIWDRYNRILIPIGELEWGELEWFEGLWSNLSILKDTDAVAILKFSFTSSIEGIEEYSNTLYNVVKNFNEFCIKLGDITYSPKSIDIGDCDDLLLKKENSNEPGPWFNIIFDVI